MSLKSVWFYQFSFHSVFPYSYLMKNQSYLKCRLFYTSEFADCILMVQIIIFFYSLCFLIIGRLIQNPEWIHIQFSSVQLLSRVRLFATPWTAGCQTSLSITNSWSPRKPMSIVSVMPSKHLIFCRPLLLSSVQFSCSVVSDSLRPCESQHTRPPCPSPTPGVHSDSCPLSQWCHPAISSSVVPFSSCPQSLPALGSLPMSQLFAWGGQSTGVSASASFLPKKSQGWSPSE